jgi:hypothetical protein
MEQEQAAVTALSAGAATGVAIGTAARRIRFGLGHGRCAPALVSTTLVIIGRAGLCLELPVIAHRGHPTSHRRPAAVSVRVGPASGKLEARDNLGPSSTRISGRSKASTERAA